MLALVRAKLTSWSEQARERYEALSTWGKALVWIWVAMHFVVMGLWWYIGADTIAAWFAGLADSIRKSPYGIGILFIIIVVTSLPPLIGYGTAQTLVGFAYGVQPGFWISAASCLGGGAFAFLVIRRLLHYFSPYLNRNPTFSALSKAVKVKGLPLMIMIRLCPFPYPYSNLFFASIDAVSFWEFMLATLCITPKLLLHVFVGHQTYLFSDPATRDSMDSTAKWVNALFMIGGSALGFGTSWYLYRQTMRYVAEAAGVDESDLEAGGLGGGGGMERGGLMQDVDEMLAGEEGSEERDREGGGEGKGRRESVGWDDERFSDFGDEDEDARRREEILASGTTAATPGKGRRDSEAWGLDDVGGIEEELIALEEPRKPQRGLRLD
ncbi:hypothetical protein JCM8547_009375 [Rhodosporidiobolus lusitaniae]